jgi:hypothetical protein
MRNRTLSYGTTELDLRPDDRRALRDRDWFAALLPRDRRGMIEMVATEDVTR